MNTRMKNLVDKTINGVVLNELRPATLRGHVTRNQIADYLGISPIEAGQVRLQLTTLVAKARVGALID